MEERPLHIKGYGFVTVAGYVALGLTLAAAVYVIAFYQLGELPAEWRDLFEAMRLVTVAIAAAAIVVFVVLWIYRHMVLRQLAGFGRGDYLVHWTYTREEWDAYLEANLTKDTRQYIAAALVTALAGAAAGCGLGFGASVLGSRIATVAIWTLGGFLAGAVVGLILMLLLRRWAASAARRQRDEPVGESYIGIGMLYCGGTIATWGQLTKLQTLGRMEGKPALLHFTFVTDSGGGTTAFEVLIPVPADRSEEADEVVRFFTAPTEDALKTRLYEERQARLASRL